MSSRGSRDRAHRIASATSSTARRLRFIASSANIALDSSAVRPGWLRSKQTHGLGELVEAVEPYFVVEQTKGRTARHTSHGNRRALRKSASGPPNDAWPASRRARSPSRRSNSIEL